MAPKWRNEALAVRRAASGVSAMPAARMLSTATRRFEPMRRKQMDASVSAKRTVGRVGEVRTSHSVLRIAAYSTK